MRYRYLELVLPAKPRNICRRPSCDGKPQHLRHERKED